MKCLITGGAGFIGSHLAEKLIKSGHHVVVLDNLSTGKLSNLRFIKNKIKFFRTDINKTEKSIHKYFKNIDWVFHLAGLADIIPSVTNPKNYFNSNVIGTFKVLEASKKANVKKLIYAASASCYGLPEKFPTNEKSKIQPQYPYALTKYLGEQLVIHWANVYGMSNISLRFFNVYGPRAVKKGTYASVFGVFLAQKLAKKPLTIIGDGNQTRDFIYITDLVDACIKAAKNGRNGEIYNLGGGKEISVNLIAKKIGGPAVHIPKRPGEPDRSLADISKIKAHFKWKPKISISKGIEIMLKNINDWKESPVWTPSKIKKSTKSWFKLLSKS